MKVSERIADHLKTRGLKTAALQDLLTKSETEGRALDADERTAFDEVEKNIKDIDETVTRLKGLEDIQLRSAQPVLSPRIEIASAAKGIRFARMCQAIAASRGNITQAVEIAKHQWPDDRDINNVLRAASLGFTRAAVAAATTTDAGWAGALASAQNLSGELIELVMKEAVIGQLSQLRRVPFNVRIPREVTAVGSVKWVGQGQSKPLGKGVFDFITIPFAKVALIVLITEELARFSDPNAEVMMRDSLVRAIRDFLDAQFVSSATAAVANVSPGGITNGLPGGQTFASTGSTLAHIQYDLTHAMSLLNTVNAPRAPTWIMHPTTLIGIASMVNPMGMPAFPTAANKTLTGYPVVTTAHLPVGEIILLDQEGVLFASDNAVSVDVSREATLQADDAPTTPPTAPLVSLWQQNLIGLKAEQFAYWMRARDADVVLVTGVDYNVAPAP